MHSHGHDPDPLPKALSCFWAVGWLVVLLLAGQGAAWGLGQRTFDQASASHPATSTLTAYYDYDAFGSTLRATGPAAVANGYRFSTKPVDEETGLVYYGYRWYHPELGRWLSRDPIGEARIRNLNS
jgi:RHS repeat-associated protein